MRDRRKCPECQAWNAPDADRCASCRHEFLWRRAFGRERYSRVVVYERSRGAPLWVRWTGPNGHERETLTNVTGTPILDRELAESIARKMSEAQELKLKGKAAEEILGRTTAEVLGLKRRRRVGELYARFERDKAPKRKGKAKLQSTESRFSRFWIGALGASTSVTDVKPARVERIVAKEMELRGWSPKTANHYLGAVVQVWRHAQVKLRWIRSEDTLEGVEYFEVPVENAHLSYTNEEVDAILAQLPAIDLRAAVAAEISLFAGRRIGAITALLMTAYRIETHLYDGRRVDFGVITFPAKTDKAKRQGEVYLVGEAKHLIEQLLEKPLVQATGRIFPRGELESDTPTSDGPIVPRFMREWLSQGEAAAGVATVPGRKYHGFKRRFWTDAGAINVAGASAQSGTTAETGQRIYAQARTNEKVELAVLMDERRRRRA